MLRCSELVCWRYEALLMDDMHMIDRNKIESSVPLTLDRAYDIPGDVQGDRLLFNEMISTVVEDKPNG